MSVQYRRLVTDQERVAERSTGLNLGLQHVNRSLMSFIESLGYKISLQEWRSEAEFGDVLIVEIEGPTYYCNGITVRGTRCRIERPYPGMYCWIHRKQKWKEVK